MWAAVLGVVFWGLLSPLVHAQGLSSQIETASGPAVISRDGLNAVLTIGGVHFVFEGMPYSAFETKVGDVVLVSLASGGTACPAEYVWLDTRPGQIRLTDRFGTCSDLPTVTWDSESVIVTLPSMVPGEGPVAFVWDGKGAAVRGMGLAHPPSGLPPAAGATVWIGRHPAEVLVAPEWQQTLLSLMGEVALRDAQRIISVGHLFAADGPWVAGGGCQPHACDVTRGAVALHQDGRIGVALWEHGQGLRVWGQFDGVLPLAMQEVMSAR